MFDELTINYIIWDSEPNPPTGFPTRFRIPRIDMGINSEAQWPN